MKEKWQEYYNINQLKSIQKIELDSLLVFKEICQKLNVDFILYGGTLLGAVKYNGFIPWDDDLDIALLRKDFDKLLKYGPIYLPKEYEFQHPTLNKITPFPYIKFRRKDTAFIEFPFRKLNMNQGIYFDIYPIDNIPDDDKLYYIQHAKMQKLFKIFSYRQINIISNSTKKFKNIIKTIIRYSISLILKLIPHKYFVKKMYYEMTKYNNLNTKRQGNYFYPKPVNYFIGIYPLIDVNFENLLMKIPNGYEINLHNRYGDISALPSPKDRYGHKPYILKL